MENKTVDFLESVYILNNLPDFYRELSCTYTPHFDYKNVDNDSFSHIKNNIVVVKDIPSYLNVKEQSLPKNVKQVKIPYYSGYAINFEGVESTQGYLKSRFGNSSRYKLRRSVKRLENAFNISYKMYYGEISQKEYDTILEVFFKLLEIRSVEKGIIKNRNVKRKDFYYANMKSLILNKRASLFVIYNGDTPIDICLNLHVDNVVCQLIRTYDINYSKYNTGYIDLIKQIDWCLANNIHLLTFMYGAFYWKKRWCNHTYPYRYDIFYNKKSIKSISKSLIQITNHKLRHYLRERGYIDRFHNIKNSIKEKLHPKESLVVTTENIDYDKELELKELVDIYSDKYSFLRRYAFDFLFNYNEKEKDISLYSMKNNSNKYLIKGIKSKAILNIQ
ncbi:GNAT family N-acetyltransferase [Hyunsoonleella flava]|uniref:GNAT family N-acetyltransferase n=1 Tax=Hyunsoonleella flava TaxID=2527939 RepID=A0A4Q9FHR5_9FLAO|nr:GNAT family N-acetyltransferase [Hyunsoonleella flava]TBN06502.1 GNAT family N-acetyltransferase [Hyunsoonleella flava]